MSLTDIRDLIPGDESEKSAKLIDPFDGQTLRFKSDHGPVLMYGVGHNTVDHGGEIVSEKPLEGDLGYSIAECRLLLRKSSVSFAERKTTRD